MQKGLLRFNLVACFVLGIVIACSMAVKIWPHLHLVSTVQAQGRMMTVIVDPPHSNDPIEVVRVTIAGKASVLGAPSANDLRWWHGGASPWNFSRVAYRSPGDDKWIESLSFVLRNRTTKKIARVEIMLQLPETGWQHGRQFHFGQFPAPAAYFGDGEPIPQTGQPITFSPCGEMTFALGDDQGGLGQLRAEPPQPISQVYARLMVYLEDGLKWGAYGYERPDPEHPGQWVPGGSPYFPPNGLPGPAMKVPAPGQPPFACSGSSTRGGESLP